MFCPQCKAEYRPGFTLCSDCQTDLVQDLPESSDVPNTRLAADDLREVWVGQSQEECVANCAELRAAGVPYHVLQHERQYFKGVDGNFRIGVLPEFFEQAKTIIEQGTSDDSDDPGSGREFEAELPTQDDKAPTDADDEHLDWKDEAPDDATVEVASESDRDFAGMIVLALRENDIESRTAVLPDGSRKIFVTPRDESRAQEIVREIQSETPPE
jgi:hypothetical protein